MLANIWLRMEGSEDRFPKNLEISKEFKVDCSEHRFARLGRVPTNIVIRIVGGKVWRSGSSRPSGPARRILGALSVGLRATPVLFSALRWGLADSTSVPARWRNRRVATHWIRPDRWSGLSSATHLARCFGRLQFLLGLSSWFKNVGRDSIYAPLARPG